MKFLVLSFLSLFDFFYKKKILVKLKELISSDIDIFFDVGAHKGETVNFILKHFNVNKIFAFEPLENNFIKLKKNTNKNKLKEKNIEYFNFALGERKEIKYIKEMNESSSSTFNQINQESNYFKRKNRLLNFSNKKFFYLEKKVSIEKAKDIIIKYQVKKIDFLKIDTEGYELNVLKGFEEQLGKINIILFEHHYDLMIKKNYTFSDINNFLNENGFLQKGKFKMPFRKTFEYIYFNERYK
jgi:FkbM family methyltransferase